MHSELVLIGGASQDELGRKAIQSPGCRDASGQPVTCYSEAVYDLRWESQLQVRLQMLDHRTRSSWLNTRLHQPQPRPPYQRQ